MPEDFHLSAFLPYRLAVLSERVSRRLSVEYERTHGLSVAEWRVLVHLQRCGKVSVRDIHDFVNLDKPRVSRAVARLEAAGMVRKLAGRVDGRLVDISLTAKGESALAEIVPIVTGIEARLLDGLTAAELSTFCAVMEKIHARLDADSEARPRSRLDALRENA
ncbi:MarR family transcriptional regulator [Sulfitobacter sp. D35]|uniref:MarR family winged helix-turn-helix transcriptional regulator n=1 Tax=Sulfitobacter sp. D35 TaxID=3083252 RepID=UPI00296EB27A|nr:MarR family transcriptional regulator [Sulfitobacter sp. D35]MDW4498500.1 MarR family transcriptional regulator [Sulfitobacter sp. D35]